MQQNTVIIGVTKTTALIFNDEFANLKKIDITPYNISYSNYLPLSLKLLVDAPRILAVIRSENEQLKNIINNNNVDIVISDNRFGLYNKHCECIYLTHQLTIQAGCFGWLANKIHHHYIKKYNAVWIPDFENEKLSLAGKLSKSTTIKNVTYIGAHSRLQPMYEIKKDYEYLFLISGPEPQRQNFESILINLANSTALKIAVVRGSTKALQLSVNNNITIFDAPNAKQLALLIQASHKIICRSGYSTLMDLHALQNFNCLLVPTPGQTEQFYLANYWKNKFNTKVLMQNKLHLFKL